MTIPPLLPRILDFSLPISSSPSSPTDTGMRMLLPRIRTLMVPISLDIHFTPCNTDSYLRDMSLALQCCESNISHRLRNGQDAQQSIELVRSAVETGSANPESTSECLRTILGDRSLIFLDLDHLVLLPSPSLEGVSHLPSSPYRTFLSERNSPGSMDWPPIGSVLFPVRGNVRRDREGDIGLQVSNISLPDLYRSIGSLTLRRPKRRARMSRSFVFRM